MLLNVFSRAFAPLSGVRGSLAWVPHEGYLPIGQVELLRQLVRRDILGRYRGSLLGLGWTLVMPAAMLGVYSLVFLGVFKTRWLEGTGGGVEFAINVFAGLVVFGLFAEVLSRAPVLVADQPNFVKRVVFPLPVLGWVAVFGAMFHALFTLVVLLVAAVATGYLSPYAVASPLALLMAVPVLLGFSWFLSALGVYVRDVRQVVGVVVSLTMFLSPVFYPMSALPQLLRELAWLNPLVLPIELLRAMALGGTWPTPWAIGAYVGLGLVTAILGALWFRVAARGFGDVL